MAVATLAVVFGFVINQVMLKFMLRKVVNTKRKMNVLCLRDGSIVVFI